jgi:antitoxin component YwqK of YwqJK toxin-antitoxin module
MGLFKGKYNLYRKNGQLEVEVNYINNKKEGIEKNYDYNGQLYSEVNYVNGIQQ